jgi:ABC-type antimicrobial peptide transport system permease subunit
MALVVRTRVEPDALARPMGATIGSIDPEQPLYDVRTLERVLDRSLARRWMQTTLLGAFASIALLLAGVGVYGVVAYTVGQRIREFGIRLALGARRREIVSLVLSRGLRLFAASGAIGLAASAATVHVLAGLIYGVRPLDPPSFAAATMVLCLVGCAACALPAIRASRIDPSVTLRRE